jgi:hypothetical protein
VHLLVDILNKNMESTNTRQFTKNTILSATQVPRPAAKEKCIARRSNGLARWLAESQMISEHEGRVPSERQRG